MWAALRASCTASRLRCVFLSAKLLLIAPFSAKLLVLLYFYLCACREQGSHTAMKSGMLAAEAIYPALTMHGEAGTVAAAGEELLLMPEGRVGLEVKEYEAGN